MDIFQSVILGLVEGITEFLPVSSTGHLILTSKLLGLAHTDYLKTFEIAIQLGAILSVVVLYWKKIFRIDTIKKLIVGFIPTAIIGFALYGAVKQYLIGNEWVVLSALFVGGIALIAFECWYKKQRAGIVEDREAIVPVSYKQSFVIGLFQSLAIVPGVSRSAASVVGGLLLKLPRSTVVEFSFLLAVPTLAAATGYDLLKNYHLLTPEVALPFTVGFVAAFVSALIAILFLSRFVEKHTFVPFGIYRIVVALIFAGFILF